MNETLEAARDHVMELIQDERVPEHLVADISMQDLTELVSSLVTEGIKERLEPALDESMSDDDAQELIQGTMEAIAQTVGLICIQAVLSLIDLPGALLGDEEGETKPDLQVQLKTEQVALLLTTLLRQEAITIGLSLQ